MVGIKSFRNEKFFITRREGRGGEKKRGKGEGRKGERRRGRRKKERKGKAKKRRQGRRAELLPRQQQQDTSRTRQVAVAQGLVRDHIARWVDPLGQHSGAPVPRDFRHGSQQHRGHGRGMAGGRPRRLTAIGPGPYGSVQSERARPRNMLRM